MLQIALIIWMSECSCGAFKSLKSQVVMLDDIVFNVLHVRERYEYLCSVFQVCFCSLLFLECDCLLSLLLNFDRPCLPLLVLNSSATEDMFIADLKCSDIICNLRDSWTADLNIR